MTATAPRQARTISELASAVVAAYVTRNPVDPSQVGALLVSVEQAFLATSLPAAAPAPVPAVPVADSVRHDYIVSLETGGHFRSLKRHLTGLGMTPDEYRAKWNLPGNYPMVAPAYSARRSDLAKQFGLGRRPETVESTAVYLDPAQTIDDAGILNLLTGRVVKDLGRDLARLGITSDSYRARFGLPANYPMKLSRAANYLATLSA